LGAGAPGSKWTRVLNPRMNVKAHRENLRETLEEGPEHVKKIKKKTKKKLHSKRRIPGRESEALKRSIQHPRGKIEYSKILDDKSHCDAGIWEGKSPWEGEK